MQVPTHLATFAEGTDKLVRTSLRMRTCEPDALQSINLFQSFKKPREGLRIGRFSIPIEPRTVAHTIAQYALPQKADFLYTTRGKARHLSNHLLGGTGIFVSADIRDDAVAATVVAPEKNRHEAAKRISGILCGGIRMRIETFRDFILVRDLETLRPFPFKRISRLLKVGYDFGNHSEPARTDGEIKLRKLLENLRPKPFDRTPHQSHNTRTILQRVEISAFPDGLLFRLLAHRAGVDDYDIGISLTFGADVSCRLQHRPDSLGVAYIHLTTVCMNMEFHSLTHSRIGQKRKPANRPNTTPITYTQNIIAIFCHKWRLVRKRTRSPTPAPVRDMDISAPADMPPLR